MLDITTRTEKLAGDHSRITVWQNHGLARSLIVQSKAAEDVAARLRNEIGDLKRAYGRKFKALVELCGILDGDGPLSENDRQRAMQIAAGA